MKRGEEVELEISASAFEGKSIARHQGLVVFVDGGVPGDSVVARISKVKRNLVEARLQRLLKPSPIRCTPRCPYFGTCGGCKWQHVEYSGQLQFKQQHVVDAFQRIGGFSDVPLEPIVGAEEIFFYRNKMEFSFSDQEWLIDPGSGELEGTEKGYPREAKAGVFLGLHVPQRYDKILDLEECFLQSDVSNRILGLTRKYCRETGAQVYSSDLDSGYLRFLVIRQSKRTNEIMVNLVTRTDDPAFMTGFAEVLRREIGNITTIVNTINTRKAQVAFGETERVYAGDGVIHERLGSHTFVISAGSFFQTNTRQAEHLYEIVRQFGEFRKSDTVFDLYSGTGSIALFISSDVRKVVGVESIQSALSDAERNCAVNGITNCAFVLGDLKDRLTVDTNWMAQYPVPDTVILDPPRSGVHTKVLEVLARIGPPKIIYVSCNPATQARDIKLFCGTRYRLERMQPVDMFPHTYHIENVALLTRLPA